MARFLRRSPKLSEALLVAVKIDPAAGQNRQRVFGWPFRSEQRLGVDFTDIGNLIGELKGSD